MNFDGGIERNHIGFHDKDYSKRVTRNQMSTLFQQVKMARMKTSTIFQACGAAGSFGKSRHGSK